MTGGKENNTSFMKEKNMKPKRTQRQTGPGWQGKSGKNDQKTTLCPPHPAKLKPFAGKVFYLDLPSNRIAETLERDVKELGGTVEKFFSKEIKYIVSNKREAKYAQCLRQDSPLPSPDSGQSSPHPRSNPPRPGSRADISQSKSRGQTETFVVSRGKSLVQRVVKEKERLQMNKILSNALEWGVKILYIDDVRAYVEKKKKIITSLCPVPAAVKTSVKTQPAAKHSFQKCKGGRISKPFVKVEDSSRHYCPIFLSMPNMPELSLKTVPPCSPFCLEDKYYQGNRQRGHRGVKASASEERAHCRKKNRDKKRRGYCECCMVKYENLTTSQRHRAFSKSGEYHVVDSLVSTLHCSFNHIKSQVTSRPKCSASSVLNIRGLSGKTKLRHRGERNTTEVSKEEQRRTVDGREESSACKRTCIRRSLTPGSQKAEQDEIPHQKFETATSRGESLSHIPSRVCQVNPDVQISHTDISTSTSHFRNVHVPDDVHSRSLNVITNQQEECDNHKESSLFEAFQHGDIRPREMTANNLSEREGGPPTQSHAPVRTIQRKVRVYKHNRRKANANIVCEEHVKTNDIRDDSLLKLWGLFESSDEMDLEFLGFDDQQGTTR